LVAFRKGKWDAEVIGFKDSRFELVGDPVEIDFDDLAQLYRD